MKTIISLAILFSLALSLAGCKTVKTTGVNDTCAKFQCTLTVASIEGDGWLGQNFTLPFTSIFYNPSQVLVTATVTVGSGTAMLWIWDEYGKETSVQATPGHPGTMQGYANVSTYRTHHFTLNLQTPSGKATDVKVKFQYQ